MPAFLIPAIAAGVGGLMNAFSGAAQQRQRNRQIDTAENILKKNLYDAQDLQDFLTRNTQLFNSGIASTLNRNAIRNRGTANAAVVGAAAIAPIEGQKLQAAASIEENTKRHNESIVDRIAQLETQRGGTDALGDFVSGAVGGAEVGIQLGNYLDKSPIPDDTTGGLTSPGTVNTSDIQSPQLSLGAENIQTGLNRKPKNPYIDYLGDDQLYNRSRSRLFNPLTLGF